MHKIEPIDFTGKIALVTGGASGIGAGTAQFLSQLGARVIIADVNQAALEAALPETAAIEAIACDITKADQVEDMVARIVTNHGRIDLMVNAAGVADAWQPVDSSDPTAWQRVIEINLTGNYLVCRAVGQRMLAQGAGAIVNIGSICGYGAFPGRSAYGASKAAVAHLTQSLACEWGGKGIRVNAIAPAYTRTPMVADLLAKKAFDPSLIEGRTPLKRFAEVHEMASAIAFLLSPWASYINGVMLPVDGGWTAFGAAGTVEK